MNREIKFRAWTTEGMAYNALGAEFKPSITMEGIELPARYSPFYIIATPFDFMQYIGLKDRNG